MARAALLALAVVLFCGVAHAQESVGLTLQFDSRGSKVRDNKKTAQILGAIADCVCKVKVGQVKAGAVLGQSSTFNHQSIATFTCEGPTKDGKALLATCNSNIKDGWFSSSNAKKCIKKYTDTWAVGDSIKLEKATCSNIKVAAPKP
ncbi:MAG: hypothetical protein J3K34DRAFT_427202 [Monoraphidium minutum]|nr:MAG: hypothetical protein J3K34DRAFT_427202 [Monoraphidium minutum]